MELLELFKEYLLNKKKPASKATVKNYSADIRHFVKWFEESYQQTFIPQAVNTVVAIRHKEYLNKLSPRSYERHVSSLRKFFAYLKDQGLADSSPFEIQPITQTTTPTDLWKKKEFKEYLYNHGSSYLTIKNYIIDVQGFIKWMEEALEKPGFEVITPELIEEYKQRLLALKKFSPRSINRKLSSIRKYLSYAKAEGLVPDVEVLAVMLHKKPKETMSLDQITLEKKESYSLFPPVRLIQKIFKPYEIAEDKIASKIAEKIREKKEETQPSNSRYEKILHQIKNIKKEFYAPYDISTASFPIHKKIYHHVRYTRPNWYKRYHTYSFTNYLHFGVLVVFASGVGYIIFQNLFVAPHKENNLFAAAPSRVLSFQGRLTDAQNNPITAATDITFAIYNAETGSVSLWTETQTAITPDSQGFFSVNLGATTPIPGNVFTDNSSLYLGIAINGTPELVPRQRLASVPYAINSETLQGMVPITDLNAGTSNVLLALDSTGKLTIGGKASPTFEATGGEFKLAGKSLVLATSTGSNGNITLAPDGSGKIDLHSALINSGNSGTFPGAVEVNDKFVVIATESAVAAFILNNNTAGGDIFTASSSGVTRFTIANDGLLIMKKYTTDGGLLFANSKGEVYQTGGGTSNKCLLGGTLPVWGSCGTGETPFWTQGTGTIYQANLTQDFLIGGTATSGAKFSVTNVASGSPVASISATSTGTGISLNGNGTIQSLLNSNLTIGGNTTGNIILSPNNGLGSVGIGTTTPIGVLNVNGTAPGKALTILNETGGNDIFTASAGGNTRFVIANNGNVGIGNSRPSSALDVWGLSGTASVASFSGNTSFAGLVIDNSGTGDILTASSSGMTRLTLTNNGNLGIGTATPGARLQVGNQGDGSIARANSWNTFSDIRFKDNINVIGDALNKVLALNGVSFTWRNSGLPSIGFVAQDVEKIVPEIVSTDAFGFKSLDYGKITPLLVNAIHDQQNQISSLMSGVINTGTVVASALNITTDSITIAGQSLKDFIVQTINTSKITLISPLVEADQISTNFISPLADSSDISLSLNDSKLTIHESRNASSSAVAEFDNKGNATLSGTLTSSGVNTGEATVSNQLSVNNLSANNATVAGTLRADRIIANNIEGLDSRIASIAATFSNQNQSSVSGNLSLQPLTTNYQPITNFVDISSFSANFATFHEGLIAFGPTTLEQLSVLDSISIGTNFTISSNSINLLGGDLEIQPLRQGGVSFLAGAVKIEADGNLKVNENAKFAKDVQVMGTLSANVISPLPQQDLNVTLPDSSLNVQDGTGNKVLSINQVGDVTASGSGTFGKLNLSFASPAYALNDTQAVATGSAGTATLKKYRTEITVYNPLITKDSLIYITPVGTTTSILSLLRQTPNTLYTQGSFTVGANSIAGQDIQFNWMIVN